MNATIGDVITLKFRSLVVRYLVVAVKDLGDGRTHYVVLNKRKDSHFQTISARSRCLVDVQPAPTAIPLAQLLENIAGVQKWKALKAIARQEITVIDSVDYLHDGSMQVNSYTDIVDEDYSAVAIANAMITAYAKEQVALWQQINDYLNNDVDMKASA